MTLLKPPAEYQACQDEMIAIRREIEAMAPTCRPLIKRWDNLSGAAQEMSEDRVLRVVRQLCHEYEAPDLWRRIACLVLELDHLAETDDAPYRSQAQS